jgi:hypothetical protein
LTLLQQGMRRSLDGARFRSVSIPPTLVIHILIRLG